MLNPSPGRWAPARVLADLERLALRAPTRAAFFDEAAARLKRAVPFDGACWHTLDPGSDLITQHQLQDIEDHFSLIAENEYAVEDVNKFEALARAERSAATISQATGGHPERSPRFRDLLNPGGLTRHAMMARKMLMASSAVQLQEADTCGSSPTAVQSLKSSPRGPKANPRSPCC